MKMLALVLLLIASMHSYSQLVSERDADSLLTSEDNRIISNKELINKPFPAFSFVSNGEVINNASILGKTVYINFWFEGCPPCVAEFDALSEMHQLLKNQKNTEFITFTFDSDASIVKARVKYNLNYRIISISRDECYRLNNSNGFPTSMLLDKYGKINWISSGGHLEKEKVKKFIIGYVYPKMLRLL